LLHDEAARVRVIGSGGCFRRWLLFFTQRGRFIVLLLAVIQPALVCLCAQSSESSLCLVSPVRLLQRACLFCMRSLVGLDALPVVVSVHVP